MSNFFGAWVCFWILEDLSYKLLGYKLAKAACIYRLISEEDSWAEKDEFLQEVVFNAYERRKSQTEIINAMPLYPTENSLWDENQIPSVHYTGQFSILNPNPWSSKKSSLFSEAMKVPSEGLRYLLQASSATWKFIMEAEHCTRDHGKDKPPFSSTKGCLNT